MKNIYIAILFFSLTACALFSPNPNRENMLSNATMELKPFTTDYCSDYPNGTKSDPEKWGLCCFSHDLHYWVGGTEAERSLADQELKACVKKTNSPLEAFFMYIGVRMGGHPGNASFSWGYGWTIKRDYQQISSTELIIAKNLLTKSEYTQKNETKNLIQNFINESLDKRIQKN